MAIDTFMAYVGVYDDVADAEADYELVKDLHTEAGLIDAYDAAVIERRDGRQDQDRQEARDADARRRRARRRASAWPPAWSSRCSRSPPSAAACSSAPRPAARSSARSPVTRRPG